MFRFTGILNGVLLEVFYSWEAGCTEKNVGSVLVKEVTECSVGAGAVTSCRYVWFMRDYVAESVAGLKLTDLCQAICSAIPVSL